MNCSCLPSLLAWLVRVLLYTYMHYDAGGRIFAGDDAESHDKRISVEWGLVSASGYI